MISTASQHPVTQRTLLGPPIAVDTHVHIHDCFQLSQFFDAAARNFSLAVRDHESRQGATGALLLTEVEGTSVYDLLWSASDLVMSQLGEWQIYSTPDPRALLFEKPSTLPLMLVAGRQVRVQGGLEVLALGCRENFTDGMAIEAALQRTRDCRSLPVLPWGFGKWTLFRGRRIRELILREDPSAFCLGDVGGRWRGLSEPPLLAEGRSQGFAVLPGSDPLPFSEQVGRAGSSGLVLPHSLRLDRAVEGLLRSLPRTDIGTESFMNLERLGPFVQQQIRMQLRKL